MAAARNRKTDLLRRKGIRACGSSGKDFDFIVAAEGEKSNGREGLRGNIKVTWMQQKIADSVFKLCN